MGTPVARHHHPGDLAGDAVPEVLRRQAQMLADLADAGEIAGIHFEGLLSRKHIKAPKMRTTFKPRIRL
ncbi:hypothetical protein [Mobiluncus mulieris]|uniref:hypothetical protein n=1 Tax=Mobiluncus mulieris TaxID=2052 RepID=UPI002091FFDA|nr:hypothetical protein [Mobiluncus mulieris]